MYGQIHKKTDDNEKNKKTRNFTCSSAARRIKAFINWFVLRRYVPCRPTACDSSRLRQTVAMTFRRLVTARQLMRCSAMIVDCASWRQGHRRAQHLTSGYFTGAASQPPSLSLLFAYHFSVATSSTDLSTRCKLVDAAEKRIPDGQERTWIGQRITDESIGHMLLPCGDWRAMQCDAV